MRKQAVAGAVALALAGAGAAAVAQEPTPEVGVSVGAKSITVTGAEALRSGPTRFTFRVAGKGERGFALFRLKPGVTRAQVTKATPKIKNPADAEKYGAFVASGFIVGKQTYTTTIPLQQAEYVVVDFTRRPVVRKGFTVAPEANTAVLPEPAATIGLEDYGFSGPATLPRSGVLRITNEGDVVHHALAFPLSKRVNARKLLAKLKRGGEPGRRDFAGPPSALVEPVSGGAQNDVEAKLRPGRTLLVCFLQNTPKAKPHSALGMARVVTVE